MSEMEVETIKKNHGGRRTGAGPKRRHDESTPVRMLKVRATDEQWAIIMQILPRDTAVRAAFLAALPAAESGEKEVLDEQTADAV